jgi:hypothetical protein
MRFILLFLISLNAFGASIWPNGTRLETFQNGFLFGNGETIDATSSQVELSTGLEVLGPIGFEQQLTPSNPSAGFNKLYFKSDEKLYSLDSAGTEKPIGGAQVAGQEQTPADASLVEVPNNQATETDTNSFLLETGNNNLLTNPSFEHSTFDSGWTVTGTAVSSEELSVLVSGKKSFEVVATAQTFRLEQKSTIYASQIGDTQGLATIRIKNTNPLLKVCSISNDVDGNCIDVESDNQWHLYEIPFLLGSTNSGLVVKAESSTGTAYIDDAYVGIIKPGMITETGAVGPWIEYVPVTQGLGAATISAFYRINGDSIEIDAKVTPGTTNGDEARLGLPSGFVSAGTNRIPTLRQAGVWFVGDSATNKGGAVLIEPNVTYVTFSSRDVFGSSSTNPIGKNVGTVTLLANSTVQATIPIAGLNSRVSLYSQQCRKPSDCENVFSAKVAADGTVSAENLDWINGNAAIASTSTYTLTFNPSIFTVAPNCTSMVESSVNFDATMPSTSSTTAVTRIKNSNDGTAQALGYWIICTKAAPDYKERNMITGSFEGIEKCADPYECTDTFSAVVQANGTITSENLDFINGNCTNSSESVCTFNSGIFTQTPSCVAIAGPRSTQVVFANIVAQSSSSVTIGRTTNATSLIDPFTLICQKQGVDFRPKTAVAGTFIDSVVNPNGGARVTFCAASFDVSNVETSDTCNMVSSNTGGSPRTVNFTASYWASAPSCWCNAAFNSSLGSSCDVHSASTSSIQASMYNNNARVNNAVTVFCLGYRQ